MRGARALLTGVVSCVVACAAQPEPVRTHELAFDVALDVEEMDFLGIINDYRADNGRGALIASPTLCEASDGHSHDLADQDYFSHTGLDGRDPSDRCADAGYPSWCGENIFAGDASADGAFDAWRDSPGHNANMLDADYRAIGIGRAFNAASTYGWYWTNNFGTEVDGDVGCPCADGDVQACANGACAGEQVCADCGWGACDAPAPAEETCNGVDDDCDGETDEGLDCGGDADTDSDTDGDTDGDADGDADADADSDGDGDDGFVDGDGEAADEPIGFEGGCGCAAAGSSGAGWALGLLVACLPRRRRVQSEA